MATRLDDFKRFAQEYTGLLSAFVVAGAALPLAASAAHLSPPWPAGMLLISSIVDFLALSFAFITASKISVKSLLRKMTWSAMLLAVVTGGYLLLSTLLIDFNSAGGFSTVKGFVCTADAAAVYGDRCPWLGSVELAEVAFDNERLWTHTSIAVARIALASTWICFCALFGTLVGSLVANLMHRKSELV